MSRLDRRTRTSADIRTVDATDFFERELPSLIASRSHLAVDGAREFGIGSLSFVMPSGSWTLSRTDDGLTVESGDKGSAAIQIGDKELGDFVNDLTTLQMLLSLGKITLLHGALSDMNGWWAVLRSLLDERPVYTAGSVRFQDREGKPLDLTRSFTPDDDDAEILHFLAEAGFLHLSGWLDEDLMQSISADIDRVMPTCTPTDGSWWATMEDGTKRPVRIIDFARHSEGVRKILASDAFLRIGRLADDGYRPNNDVEALHKPLGVATGISNIGWHADCTQGMHSYSCCGLVVGVSVTGAGPGSAQLGVVPGSHRALMPVDQIYPHTGFEPLFVTTRTGDMTVHCTCTMHMAKAPTEYERQVLYTGFSMGGKDDRTLAEEQKTRGSRDEAQKMAGDGNLTMV